MAKCKCRLCKTELNSSDAYKVIIKDRPAYFCNATHYAQFNTELERQTKARELKDKFYNLFCEVLGVEGITNTALFKEKAEINKVFSDDIIVSFLDENKDWMKATVSRLNSGEYGRIRYVSTILKNKLGDFKPKATEAEKPKIIVQEEFYESQSYGGRRRRSLEDLEDEY